MKTAICVVALMFLAMPMAASAHDRHDRRQVAVPRSSVHVVFSNADVRVLREYYAPQYRSLPPGLRKKYARTGQLPPGWAKRVQPIPVYVERQFVVLPPDYRRGVIDGNAVIYSPRRGVIIDATVLF